MRRLNVPMLAIALRAPCALGRRTKTISSPMPPTMASSWTSLPS